MTAIPCDSTTWIFHLGVGNQKLFVLKWQRDRDSIESPLSVGLAFSTSKNLPSVLSLLNQLELRVLVESFQISLHREFEKNPFFSLFKKSSLASKVFGVKMTSTGLRRGGNAHMSATYSANASSDRMDIDESMKASYAGYESEEFDSSDEWPKPPKLPYDVSYVGKWAPPMRPRPEKKIWPTAERPITTRSELPPGWTDNEDDLFEEYVRRRKTAQITFILT